jgi:hypothetical protein
MLRSGDTRLVRARERRKAMIATALGWIGTVGTFVAYLLVSRGHLNANSRRYGSLNMVGGLLGGSAAVVWGAWPSAASNFVWAVIGALTVYSATQRSPMFAGRRRTSAAPAPVAEPACSTCAGPGVAS